MIRICLCLFIPLAILLSCTPSGKQEAGPNLPDPKETVPVRLDLPALGDFFVERMDLQEGEKVFFLARPGRFDSLIPVLAKRVEEAGGEYLGTFSTTAEQPGSWKTPYTVRSSFLKPGPLESFLRQADLGIMLPGASPEDTVYALRQHNLRRGRGRTIHFHWSGAYGLDGQPIALTPEIDSFYQHVLLNTDYEELANQQAAFERALRRATVRVTTPDGTDISFRVEDQPVTRQDGNASAERMEAARNLIDREVELPAGVVRVAPVLASVNGTIAIPVSFWGGKEVRELRLTIEEGKVTDMRALSGLSSVKKELKEAGAVGKSFREFALGFNPLLAIPETDPWIPYYGYGAGVVRLSLGDRSELLDIDPERAKDESPLQRSGYIRWNFFPDATVTVGRTTWVEQGKLVR